MKPGLPRYVWDLHEAAKFVAHPPSNAMADDLARLHEQLNGAVIAFEAAMPLVDGECQVSE